MQHRELKKGHKMGSKLGTILCPILCPYCSIDQNQWVSRSHRTTNQLTHGKNGARKKSINLFTRLGHQLTHGFFLR